MTVAGLEVAIVLKAKKGPALLIQTRAVNVKAALDASWEVSSLLASHASDSKDDDGSGDNPPGYASGDMSAGNNRFRVVYRLVNQVYVMAVAPAAMNVFFSTQLVNAVVHQLCSINRSIILTPEKLTARFPEVYLAVSALLANGGQVKTAAAQAEQAVDSISSEATKAVKQLRKSFTNPLAMLRSSENKPLPQKAESLYVAPRSLAEEVDPLTMGGFRLPEDALPPLAYVEPEKPSAAPAAGWDMSGYTLQPLSPTASEKAAEEAEGPGELGPDKPIGGDMWSNFPEGPRPDAPPISELDLPVTPTGPRGLWLEEIWRCHVVGREIRRAGTLGQVLGTAPLTKEHIKTVFRLRPPQQTQTAVLKALQAAQPDTSITVRMEDWYESGCHVAAFDQTFGKLKPVFLQYRLPAVVLPPPLQVRFVALLSEAAEGSTRRRLTLCLRYVVNPGSLLPLYAATVDLDLHPHLGAPLKVSPTAMWARKQNRVQWRLPPLAPGASGDLKAYFEPEAKDDGLAAAGKRGGLTASAVEEAICRLRFTGPPRASLSGTGLEAGLGPKGLETVAETSFFGELTAQAELVYL